MIFLKTSCFITSRIRAEGGIRSSLMLKTFENLGICMVRVVVNAIHVQFGSKVELITSCFAQHWKKREKVPDMVYSISSFSLWVAIPMATRGLFYIILAYGHVCCMSKCLKNPDECILKKSFVHLLQNIELMA